MIIKASNETKLIAFFTIVATQILPLIVAIPELLPSILNCNGWHGNFGLNNGWWVPADKRRNYYAVNDKTELRDAVYFNNGARAAM